MMVAHMVTTGNIAKLSVMTLALPIGADTTTPHALATHTPPCQDKAGVAGVWFSDTPVELSPSESDP